MVGVIAAVKLFLETLKSVGLIRDRKQEADIQAQFLSSTSGPIYGIARVTVVYASLWDIFFNGARAWVATGLPTLLEYLPIAWLFIGPAIVPLAEGLLKARGVQPKPPSVSTGQPAGVDNTENRNESAPYTSRTGFRKEP